ncbi:hypothetical protein BTHI11S_06101 [Bosea thiooxidans]
MQRSIRILTILAGLGLSAMAAQAQDFPKINLKVSGGNQTQNLFQKVYKPFFTETLAAKTNGAITTTFGSLEELGLRGPEVLRLLRQGVFDISEATMSYMAGEDSRFDGLDLPGVTVDIATQRKAADAFRPALAKALETKYNTKLLSMSPVAAQMFYCKGDITGLDSLRGKAVRTFNRAMSQMVEGAGGSSVNVPFAEVIPAMQRGVAQCAVTGTSAGNTARWWEVSDHLYALPMGWSMTFFGANLRSWSRLDEKARAFLEQQFAELEDRMWAQAGSDLQDVFYLILGCFMEPLPMMIVTIPIIVPVVVQAGFDPVWFGIMVVLLCETAMITPPVGVNLYVVQGVRGRGVISDVILGVLPFIGSLLAMIVLIIAAPDIVMWLPRLIGAQ